MSFSRTVVSKYYILKKASQKKYMMSLSTIEVTFCVRVNPMGNMVQTCDNSQLSMFNQIDFEKSKKKGRFVT